jgi:hypothetical protein
MGKLKRVEERLRRGEAHLSEEVAVLTMMIRTAKTIPLLNDATLCIQEKSSKAYFSCKLGELPHPSIILPDRLQFGAACKNEAYKLSVLCSDGVSHVHLGESESFDAFIYQEVVCSRLLAEHGHTVTRELPRQIAKLAKEAGLSSSNRDFHPAFKSPPPPSSHHVTSRSARTFLEQEGVVATDGMISKVKGQAQKMMRNDGACMRCSEALTKEKRKFCGKCRIAAYCSKKCQVADWEGGPHKALCGAMACPLDLQVLHDQLGSVEACFEKKKLAF